MGKYLEGEMKATVLDTVTGQSKEASYNMGSWNWYEGNWSCDCNREAIFSIESDTGFCLGGKRFLVIKAEFEKDEVEYTLDELNEEYPKELKDKFLPKAGV